MSAYRNIETDWILMQLSTDGREPNGNSEISLNQTLTFMLLQAEIKHYRCSNLPPSKKRVTEQNKFGITQNIPLIKLQTFI
jgi:hypothetical protein